MQLIREQIRCGGLSAEGLFVIVRRSGIAAVAAFALAGCAAEKPIAPIETLPIGALYEYHEQAPVKFEVISDNGVSSCIGIKINGSNQLIITMPSDDFRREIIQKPENWKQRPVERKMEQ